MFKRVIIFIFLSLPLVANAQFSSTLLPTVRTTRMVLNDEWDLPPVMQLGSDDVLHFSFDEMSHVYHRYTCRIVHCNGDWGQSDLLEIDY